MRLRKNWPVNWVDGMKVNKTHFLLQDENLREQLEIVTSLQLNEFNYGLIEGEGNRESLSLIITSERVELNTCRAVTYGGHYIEVSAINSSNLEKPLSDLWHSNEFNEADIWTLILRVDPSEKDLLGKPNPKETPLRHPYATPRLSLELIPAADIVNAEAYFDAVPIAQVIRKYQGIERVPGFIPPLTRMRASLQLTQTHKRWQQQIVETENYLYEIVRKINDKHIHGNHNPLSQDLLNMTSSVMRYINDQYDRYALLIPSQPPIEMILWFMGMARVIVSEMRLAANSDNLEKYIAFFVNDADRYQLLFLSTALKDLRYDHGDLATAVATVERFLSAVNFLFGQLRTLQYNEIADPTIINSMRTGNMMNQAASSSSRPSLTNTRPPAPQPSNQPSTVSGGKRKISIRRSNRNLTDPPGASSEDGNFWDLED